MINYNKSGTKNKFDWGSHTDLRILADILQATEYLHGLEKFRRFNLTDVRKLAGIVDATDWYAYDDLSCDYSVINWYEIERLLNSFYDKDKRLQKSVLIATYIENLKIQGGLGKLQPKTFSDNRYFEHCNVAAPSEDPDKPNLSGKDFLHTQLDTTLEKYGIKKDAGSYTSYKEEHLRKIYKKCSVRLTEDYSLENPPIVFGTVNLMGILTYSYPEQSVVDPTSKPEIPFIALSHANWTQNLNFNYLLHVLYGLGEFILIIPGHGIKYGELQSDCAMPTYKITKDGRNKRATLSELNSLLALEKENLISIELINEYDVVDSLDDSANEALEQAQEDEQEGNPPGTGTKTNPLLTFIVKRSDIFKKYMEDAAIENGNLDGINNVNWFKQPIYKSYKKLN